VTDISDVDAAKAVAHPLRVQILEALYGEPRSPKALSQELGVRLSSVARHIVVLRDLGAIELTGTRPARGALEHFYRARWKVRVAVEPVD